MINILKKLRLEQGYTQRCVAQALGMSQPNYSKLEHGKRVLDDHAIRALAKLYGVTTDTILYGGEYDTKK